MCFICRTSSFFSRRCRSRNPSPHSPLLSLRLYPRPPRRRLCHLQRLPWLLRQTCQALIRHQAGLRLLPPSTRYFNRNTSSRNRVHHDLILSVFLLLGLVCLAVNWNLACVIVVVESTWGLSPLKWSRNLVRGMQAVTLSLLLFFGFLAGMLIWSNSSLGLSGFGDKWKSWAFVVDIVVFSSFMTVLLQYNFSNIRLHYANVTVGTPPLSFLVALDMGNDLFWLPCDCSSCVRGLRTSRGQEIEFNIYSPNTSSTSSKAPCNSTMCGHKRRCSAQNTCPYEVVYLLMEHYLKGTW